MKNIIKFIGIGFAVSTLLACSSNSKNYAANSTNVASAETSSQAIGDNVEFYGEDLTKAEEQALLEKNIVHFDFDRTNLSDKDLTTIYAHAKYLLQHPSSHLRIAGHADKFGSHEYNIGLGERRANAVVQILMLKGVSSSQLSTVSYGKESPFSLSDDEESWALNRRAELIYLES